MTFYRGFIITNEGTLGYRIKSKSPKAETPRKLLYTYTDINTAKGRIDRYIDGFMRSLPRRVRGVDWPYDSERPFLWLAECTLLVIDTNGRLKLWHLEDNKFRKEKIRNLEPMIFRYVEGANTVALKIADFDKYNVEEYFPNE